MHSYAVDSTERRDVPFFLAAGAIGLTFGLRLLSRFFGLESEPAPVAYVSSGFVLYGVLYFLFDRQLWKSRVLRTIGIVRVPAVDGTWQGELRSSASQYSKAHPVKVRIHQSWSTIRLTLESENSFSSSEMASIGAISGHQFEIRWEYRAESKVPAQGEDFNHHGVTMLRFEVEDNLVLPEMSGQYYTQHGRDTNGTISIKREGK
jgi:hypothetical protein